MLNNVEKLINRIDSKGVPESVLEKSENQRCANNLVKKTVQNFIQMVDQPFNQALGALYCIFTGDDDVCKTNYKII